MNSISKLMLISGIGALCLVAVWAEIDGSGLFSADCEGKVTAKFVERNSNISFGVASGMGLEGIKVSFSKVGSPDLGIAMRSSDSDGHIEFTNVCPGIYRLSVGEASVPEHLVFSNVSLYSSSGAQIWHELNKLQPVDLYIAGTLDNNNEMEFSLRYEFVNDTCGGPYLEECNETGTALVVNPSIN